MIPSPTDEQLYDLLLLGLYWRRLSKPRRLPCQAVTVFGAMRHAGVIPELARLAIARNPRAMGLVTQRLVRVGSMRELTGILGQSRQPLAVLVPPRKNLNYAMLVGAEGYQMALTDAGMHIAKTKVSAYRDHIDVERFHQGFDGFRRQIGGVFAGKDINLRSENG